MVELLFGGFVFAKGSCGNSLTGGAVRSISSVFVCGRVLSVVISGCLVVDGV